MNWLPLKITINFFFFTKQIMTFRIRRIYITSWFVRLFVSESERFGNGTRHITIASEPGETVDRRTYGKRYKSKTVPERMGHDDNIIVCAVPKVPHNGVRVVKSAKYDEVTR